ncbi:Uridylate kinase [Buchnera aphidicola (Cinara pseudotaxifoliae)]|uniref:Uridylate kinase n=1 Tax=Buchnera aphidicola (Cinara pseudotaxifoliae) TaxID=655384 RepID=A0A451DGT3_9GAMM|nr:UMP kinase [Buchnera aphidicola]VFP85822.1 Uridylate kinase [Buchnera aphidicola (Cinara pseudotaxifoliae)]
MKKKNKYNRILLKISGEFLKGNSGCNININFINSLVKQVQILVQSGVQVGLVVGGGNLFRGSDLEKIGIRRTISDQIGMLSTVMNGLLIYEFIKKSNIKTRIFSSTILEGLCERYRLDQVNNALENGEVTVLCFGLGIPLFTTDSAACVYGIEIKADILLKGTKVNGIYSSDPLKNSKAKLYKKLKYQEILNKQLKVMDHTSLVLAYEHKLPILVFNMYNPKILHDIFIIKNHIGTLISE